jgi:hypothetical protein
MVVALSVRTFLLEIIRVIRDLIQVACWIGRPACMARPYSLDLRERVVGVGGERQPCRVLAAGTPIRRAHGGLGAGVTRGCGR